MPLKEKAPVFLSSPIKSSPAGEGGVHEFGQLRGNISGGLGYLQTIMAFLWFEPFGKLSKHFRLRAGAWSKARPSAFWVCPQRPFLTETTARKGLPDDRFEELDSAVILKSCFSICHCPSVSLVASEVLSEYLLNHSHPSLNTL